MERADGGGSTSRQSAAVRDTLRRPLTGSETQADAQADRSYSRTQESEITQQFPRLPNPDMVMYLYPHLADGNTPVPGYSTVFPFYSQTQYAMRRAHGGPVMLSLFTRNKSTDRQTPVDDGQSVQADETLTAAVKGGNL